jgi:hypothetical protein
VGVIRFKRDSNFVHNAFRIFEHVVVPEAKHFEPLAPQVRIPSPVNPTAPVQVVLSAINLNDKARGEAGKIDNQMIDWNLSPKMKPVSLQGTQMSPEFLFGVGLIAAQLTSTLVRHLTITPPRRLRRRPSPSRGG